MEPFATMKISVIIPLRNDLGGLAVLLDSIPQSDSLEVIVVDDCSEGESVRKFAREASSSEARFLFLEKRGFAGGARNEGLAVATGNWILFADSGDRFLPGAFEIVRREIDRNPMAEMIYFRRHSSPVGSADFVKRRLRRLGRHEARFRRIAGSRRKADLYRFNSFVPWSVAFRRDFIDATGERFREVKWGNDVWFVGKLCERAGDSFAIVNEAIYTYRPREHASLSSCRHDEAELIRVREYAELWKSQDPSIRSYSRRKKMRMWIRAQRIRSGSLRRDAIAALNEAGVGREIAFRRFLWRFRELFSTGKWTKECRVEAPH